jgi:hypothetical protein
LILSVGWRFGGVRIVDIEKNIATLDRDRDGLQAGILGIQTLPCAHIEFPMVPRTAESLSYQGALAQPAFLMGTHVSIRINVVFNIDDQNTAPGLVQTHHFTTPKVVQ